MINLNIVTNTGKLKELRTVHGYTQEEVAKTLGYSVPGYNRIETGVRRLSYENSLKLEELYGVPHEEFFLAE